MNEYNDTLHNSTQLFVRLEVNATFNSMKKEQKSKLHHSVTVKLNSMVKMTKRQSLRTNHTIQ